MLPALRLLPAQPVQRARVLAIGALAGGMTVVALVAALSVTGGDPGSLPSASAAEPAARAAAPAPPPKRPTVSIGWVGDTVPGSRHGMPADEGRALYANVRPWLRRHGLMVANLEGTLSAGGAPKCPAGTPNCFSFQAPPHYAQALRWAGVDAVNLANNHAFDFGEDGLAQTTGALEQAGIAHTGAPGQITVVRREGVRVALLGFAPYPWAASLTDLPAAVALVRRAAERADLVVVTMHAGAEGADLTHTPPGAEEYLGEPRGDPRAFAHAVVDAGADLVLGSGPHVLRGIERHNGRLIAYSLGNFGGQKAFSTAGVLGLSGLLSVRLRSDGHLVRARFVPLAMDAAGIPSVDPRGRATALVARLSAEDFGGRAVVPTPAGYLSGG